LNADDVIAAMFVYVFQKLIQKEKDAGSAVSYVTIGKKYFIRLEQVINIAVPLFVTVLPKIPKIAKFGKNRLGRLKSWEVCYT
jgi:hypothetical protein